MPCDKMFAAACIIFRAPWWLRLTQLLVPGTTEASKRYIIEHTETEKQQLSWFFPILLVNDVILFNLTLKPVVAQDIRQHLWRQIKLNFKVLRSNYSNIITHAQSAWVLQTLSAPASVSTGTHVQMQNVWTVTDCNPGIMPKLLPGRAWNKLKCRVALDFEIFRKQRSGEGVNHY